MRGESLQAPLGDIAGLGPDHPNKVNIIVKQNIHKTNLSANTDHLSRIIPVCKYLKKLPFSSSYQSALPGEAWEGWKPLPLHTVPLAQALSQPCRPLLWSVAVMDAVAFPVGTRGR